MADRQRAALSHRSAAELWGLRSGRSAPAHVTAPLARQSRPGAFFHESRLPADEVTLHDGIRVTTVPRTLFDCATILRPRQLESAMNQAELQRLLDQRIAAELDGRAFHDAQRAFDRDRARDLRLSAADWHPIRITSRMLHRSRDDLERDLRRMLGLSAATLAP